MNKTPGVYCITNTINGKVYIGATVDLDRRCKNHRSSLQKHIHHNSHLQAAWDKYGEDAFTFSVIVECSRDMLETFEQATIDKYDAANTGYNIQPTVRLSPDDICRARAASNTPRPPCSEKTKEKISQSNTRGNPFIPFGNESQVMQWDSLQIENRLDRVSCVCMCVCMCVHVCTCLSVCECV